MTVRLYVRRGCPYSDGARRLLREKGIEFEEIDATDAPEDERAALARAAGGQTTLPQAFAGERWLGGYAELQELDRRSGLRTLVAEARP